MLLVLACWNCSVVATDRECQEDTSDSNTFVTLLSSLLLYMCVARCKVVITASWPESKQIVIQCKICSIGTQVVTMYVGGSKSSYTNSHRPPTDGTTWMFFAVIESWQRRQSLCQLASLCEHWELHNTSFCHPLLSRLRRQHGQENGAAS
jgi:hypothetical protein